jgi:hypothetical protein
MKLAMPTHVYFVDVHSRCDTLRPRCSVGPETTRGAYKRTNTAHQVGTPILSSSVAPGGGREFEWLCASYIPKGLDNHVQSISECCARNLH